MVYIANELSKPDIRLQRENAGLRLFRGWGVREFEHCSREGQKQEQ